MALRTDTAKNLKLKQSFNEYIEKKRDDMERMEKEQKREEKKDDKKDTKDGRKLWSTGGITDEEKEKAIVKKITEEEAEIFEPIEVAEGGPQGNPMLVKEETAKLKWKDCNDEAANLEEVKKTEHKILGHLKSKQLLEAFVPNKEDTLVLYEYFKEDNLDASPKVIELLEKSLSGTLEKLLKWADSEPGDETVRSILEGKDMAKKWLLDALLHNPHFIPLAWGGAYCVKREEAKIKRDNERTRRSVRERKKKKAEKEKQEKTEVSARKKKVRGATSDEKQKTKEDKTVADEAVTQKKKSTTVRRKVKAKKEGDQTADGAEQTVEEKQSKMDVSGRRKLKKKNESTDATMDESKAQATTDDAKTKTEMSQRKRKKNTKRDKEPSTERN